MLVCVAFALGASAATGLTADSGSTVADTGVPTSTDTAVTDTSGSDTATGDTGVAIDDTGTPQTATDLAGEKGGVHCSSVHALPAGWLAVLLLAAVRRARGVS